MPPAPSHNALAHYVLENPWPGALLLAFVGALLTWRALTDGRVRMLVAGSAVMVAALVLVLVAWLVTTAGERAATVVRELVRAAERQDVAAGMALMAPDATLSFERPENPGFGIEAIERGLESVATVHVIERNRVTRLRGYTVDGDTGIVQMACWTTTSASAGAVPSQWIMRVRRQADGSWKVARITCVSVSGRTPDARLFGS
ncbi:MAG: nuclear transport factor 2 family protein [Phycisphaerales bacterium]|jgi:ketosteroid isomerase-like protein